MSVIANFLQRWSTIDITNENSLLFELELSGVEALSQQSEKTFLTDLNKSTKRAEFAERYRKLIKES